MEKKSHKKYFYSFHPLQKLRSIILLSITTLLIFIASCIHQGLKKDPLASFMPPKNIIIYYSHYGSTEQTAQWVAEGIGGNTDIYSIDETANLIFDDYKILILGSAVYMETVADPMKNYVIKNKERLLKKPLAIFVVCGSYLISGDRYLSIFEEVLEKKTLIKTYFGGIINMEKLNDFHRRIMEKYWEDRGQEARSFDFTEKERAIIFGREIKEILYKLEIQENIP